MIRARPEDWYATRIVGDGVTLISEPFVREFYRCNMWHVRGRDRDLLIDSGMGVVPLRRWVPLVTERALTAVASHTHFDHVGAHHEFADRIVHAAEAEILADPSRWATLADPYVTDDIFERLPPAPFDGRDLRRARRPRDAGGRGRRRDRPRRPAPRGDPHAGPLAGRHRVVGGGVGRPLLRRRGLRRPADRGHLPLRRGRLPRLDGAPAQTCPCAWSTAATSPPTAAPATARSSETGSPRTASAETDGPARGTVRRRRDARGRERERERPGRGVGHPERRGEGRSEGAADGIRACGGRHARRRRWIGGAEGRLEPERAPSGSRRRSRLRRLG